MDHEAEVRTLLLLNGPNEANNVIKAHLFNIKSWIWDAEINERWPKTVYMLTTIESSNEVGAY